MGFAMMGTARASGENAAVEAARQAIQCPLLEEGGIAGARGVLINITGSSQLGLHEVNQACTLIREAANCEDVQLSFGVVLDESMGDAVKITVIATGFDRAAPAPRIAQQPVAHAAPQPEPEPEPPPPPIVSHPEPEPAPDDLDTPAYLRRGKLLF
jgi:cell division protein FtsZ